MSTLAVVLLATTAPAPVEYDDFPTVAQVARSYPHLDGGHREMFGNHRAWVPAGADDCGGSWVFARPRPRPGKLMVYEPRRDGRPDPTRWPQVLVHGYWYRSVAEARSALTEIRTIGDCQGRHFHDGEGFVLRVLSDVPVRAPSFAYRGHAVATSPPKAAGEQWYLATFVRRGSAIVSVSVLRTTSPPARGPAFRLTRAALRAMDQRQGP